MAVSTVLSRDEPAESLLEAAGGAGTIVVGSRGLGGFGALLLGSVGLRVAARARAGRRRTGRGRGPGGRRARGGTGRRGPRHAAVRGADGAAARHLAAGGERLDVPAEHGQQGADGR
ncbi:universal stress protein [Streptomyces sp. NPDC087850]|uniref:universal stress protein n=1 Tax=Streptomyces sp. NPDC087850 TaxID=3365809 RepID=UPI00380B7B2C